MNSDDLLDQPTPDPIPDDPEIPQNSFDALSKFLNKRPQQQQQQQQQPAPGFAGTSSMAPPEMADAPQPQQTEEPPTSAESASLDAQLEEAREELDRLKMSPAERYRRILQDRDIDLVEAQQILDCIIVQLEPYQEKMALTDRVHVTFRTRTQGDQDRLNDVLETMAPRFQATMDSEVARQHLVSSLVRYGDKVFQRETDKQIEDTVRWVTDIPQPVFVLLQRKLYQFDRKIDAVFQEGYIENFYQTHS